MTLPKYFQDSSRVVTFTIAGSHFGIEVADILAFSGDSRDIQPVYDDNHPSLAGYLDYRDSLVKVYDGAALLNRKRTQANQQQLVDELELQKKAHIDWVNSLEKSLLVNQPFAEPQDAKLCKLGKWYQSFTTENDELYQIVQRIKAPHEHIHQAANHLLEIQKNGDTERALRLLNIEQNTTVRKLLRTLTQAQEVLTRKAQPVILHLTKDGKQPWFALLLEQVDDILPYSAEQVSELNEEEFSHDPIKGYFKHEGTRYMMLHIERLHQKTL